MNIVQRQLEIEVCATCSERLHEGWKKSHFYTCPGCLNEFCKNVGNYLSLEVSSHAPRGWPVTEENPRVVGGQSVEVKTINEFRGTFCEACHERVAEILVRAGLTTYTKSEQSTLTLD